MGEVARRLWTEKPGRGPAGRRPPWARGRRRTGAAEIEEAAALMERPELRGAGWMEKTGRRSDG
jgi:hypothetical protein